MGGGVHKMKNQTVEEAYLCPLPGGGLAVSMSQHREDLGLSFAHPCIDKVESVRNQGVTYAREP